MINDQKSRSWGYLLLFLYLVVLTWVIVFKFAFSPEELPHFRSINLIPFGQSVIVNGKLNTRELFLNVLAFVPFGIYLCMLKHKWSFLQIMLSALLLSFLYETAQYLLSVGAADITDLINNTLGGAIGYACYSLFSRILKEKTDRILTIAASIGTAAVLLLMVLLFAAN
ncbi:MAG: VanZ family protein [Fusicatenibacter sp.]